MNRTATQLAGNATSIFQAWLDLKRQTGRDGRTTAARDDSASGNGQRQSGT
ncbi:hypothetical protein [Marinobacter sp. HL-58]|uniref:hypothetical protein n=1 Tax=Marinobacter sp. HL-58 TaxID=1479237 RepID=UPI0006DA4949|nr:hypothetical protein [Marinobacter sp. HL-58]KPQ00219.1 MAG: hypothetical protein HLUCCO03_04085 [Marinobacter sp. HL-58]